MNSFVCKLVFSSFQHKNQQQKNQQLNTQQWWAWWQDNFQFDSKIHLIKCTGAVSSDKTKTQKVNFLFLQIWSKTKQETFRSKMGCGPSKNDLVHSADWKNISAFGFDRPFDKNWCSPNYTIQLMLPASPVFYSVESVFSFSSKWKQGSIS